MIRINVNLVIRKKDKIRKYKDLSEYLHKTYNRRIRDRNSS